MPLPPLVEPVAELSASERTRTARHTVLAGFGDISQRRLSAAHVAIVGAGGLGSPSVLALAAAGVGMLTVIDDDVVEHTNLQRQIMHRRGDIGAAKVESAIRVASDLAPETTVRARRVRLTAENAREELAGADVVIDGTDTFETRHAIAAACEELQVPLVWGTVQGFDAQVTVFWSNPPKGTEPIVLSDLYPDGSVGEVPTCADVGVLGALCMQAGGVMAIEAIKLIAGIGEPLLGRILVIDSMRARQSEVTLRSSRMRWTRAPEPASRVKAPHVTVAGALEAQASGSVLIDVREPSETANGTIPDVIELPLAELLDDPNRAGSGPIVVVCESGMRAQRAADLLRGRGVAASVLTGGMVAWREAQSEAQQTV
ncbi:adenylyltransferase/sulfurtransferase [Microbacterium halimionae]|uniref:Adenylyltransferase/sulfurtransferase n=1 Tax=Microbacterium halimionae TaxID=1526413 RepID=A0A7W3JM58_9MICO|nr:ThiF family adenylyltransferase [Microbacterium halimionae]MBA8815436.1 adenylyltransferase/sulfurtransferase [Microbacterium halimionae]NII95483.1 adenylyltransferase/sulfurtransferase [Microbacterium halimionae]